MISVQNQQRQTFRLTGISSISLADRLAEALRIISTAGRSGGILLSLSGFLRAGLSAKSFRGLLLS
jgi:hypothetical protein